MNKVTLKKIKLTRFKGIHDLTVEFSPTVTNILGRNGTGKTTVFDAFLWPLFDRDSNGQSEFNIKTLDSAGKAASRVGHEVELIIDVNGREIEIKRVFSEKWVKQRSNEDATLTGHENSYFWNGVPMKQSDFKKEVSQTICDEYIFKLITSPTAFANLNWKDKRAMLIEIAGEVSDAEIASQNPEYASVVTQLAKYKSDEDYKAMLRATVEKSKKEIKLIPARIDEVKLSTPALKDFDNIRKQILSAEKEIQRIDNLIENSSQAYKSELDKINKYNKNVMLVKNQINEIEINAHSAAKRMQQEDTSAIDKATQNINLLTAYLNDIEKKRIQGNKDISFCEGRIQNIEAELVSLREKWSQINAQNFNDSTSCVSCGQELPAEKQQELIEKFKAEKAKKLSQINKDGAILKENKESVIKQLQSINDYIVSLHEQKKIKTFELEQFEAEIEEHKNLAASSTKHSVEELYQTIISENENYKELVSQLSEMIEAKPAEPIIDNASLKEEKASITLLLDSLKIMLSDEKKIEDANNRIIELENREKFLAKEIVGVEKQVFAVEGFMKLKIDEIENRVKNKFEGLTFRMFKQNLNGGLEPCCDILVNGVPFNDANTASKINAGLSIIKTLSKHFEVLAPIFLDNRESVSEINCIDAQLVNLIVSPQHTQITVCKDEPVLFS